MELRHDPVFHPVNDNASKVPATEAQDQTHILNENPSDNHEQEQHSPTTHLKRLTFSRGFPADIQKVARGVIKNRPVFERRQPPRATREELLKVFHAAADERDFRPFMEMVERTPDGERDAVTVVTSEDLPLIRRVRRAMAASGNPHLMQDYPYFTGIVWTISKGR